MASRVKLNRDDHILGEVILLECADLNTLINRLLYPEKVRTEPGVSIKVDWKLVHVCLNILWDLFLLIVGHLIVSISKR